MHLLKILIYVFFILLGMRQTFAESPAPFIDLQSETPGSVDFSKDQFTQLDSGASKKADAIFSLVTKNPSSFPLNVQLALAQLQAGNLKGASATLDRILNIYPNDPQVQLLMAQTENRLGNTVDASNFYREVISNSSASQLQVDAAIAELNALLEDQQVWKYGGLLQAGVGRSMNPLNSSKHLTVLGFDLSNPSYAANYATTFMYFGSVSFERALESQANDSMVLTLSRFNQQYQNTDPNINYGLANLGINTGTIAYQLGAITDRLTLAWNSSETSLSNKGFMNSNWATGSYQKAIGENLLVNGGLNYGYNNQLEGANYSGLNSRSNWMTGYTFNAKYFVNTNWIAEANLARYNYAAQASYESYFMNYQLASLTYLTEVGMFSSFISNISNQYKDIEPISGLQRQIQTAGFGCSYTVSLPNLTKPERKDLSLTLNYQQSHGNSNVQTYNTQSRQYMAILSKGF